ncbi:MAG: D-alanyl-D-alanine carboxypeptidase family protein [Nevskiaceae bacterium]|nr:MAG: D-alanyl-D-alanine carboxypeptidase family protein [Nevskiaceae bacterium]TAM28746.1 MAG: D-alanyl-D-alanine carboxypeptidase family protein [Nevskiaceae bacterium]
MNRRQAGTAYRERIEALLAELGLPASLLAGRPLRLIPEAQRLAPVGLGTDGRDKLLTPGAAQAWLALRDAAARDGVGLLLISGFRSVDYQAALIRAKLARGLSAEEVLRINAPPGYSEHHSGRAVDIGCAGVAALDEAFETTPAYEWLCRNAAEHGFRMSYPRGNRQGYLYEPWHWFHQGGSGTGKP